MSKHKFKPGDLVRVSKPKARAVFAIKGKFGAVETVHRIGRDGWVELKDSATSGPYFLPPSACKLAKQAMRKRDQYEARRG